MQLVLGSLCFGVVSSISRGVWPDVFTNSATRSPTRSLTTLHYTTLPIAYWESLIHYLQIFFILKNNLFWVSFFIGGGYFFPNIQYFSLSPSLSLSLSLCVCVFLIFFEIYLFNYLSGESLHYKLCFIFFFQCLQTSLVRRYINK